MCLCGKFNDAVSFLNQSLKKGEKVKGDYPCRSYEDSSFVQIYEHPNALENNIINNNNKQKQTKTKQVDCTV